MAKQTVQGMMLEDIKDIKKKLDIIIPVLEGLKVKSALAGGIAGVVGTALVTAILSAWK